MNSPRLFANLTAATLIAGTAAAAGLTGAAAVKDRQAHMKGMGAAAKAIGDQLRGGSPDMAVIKSAAAKIDAGATDLPDWFPAGSGPSSGAKTEALPLIWTDPSGFSAKQRSLTVAAAKFDAAAQAGDAAAVGPAFHDVGAACKSCHETYKEKDKT